MEKQYGSLREKIRAEKAERQQRYVQYEELWTKAMAAGLAAGEAHTPRPMTVRNDGPQPQSWFIEDGVCGFAWIALYPGNHPFAIWAKKNKGADKKYGRGVYLYWVGEFNQSLEKKQAFANAFAEVLREAGIPAYPESRLD